MTHDGTKGNWDEKTSCFEYLDNLRESDVTNMFGAGQYLENSFGLDQKEARKILGEWMETFCCSKSPEERAHQATQDIKKVGV